MFGNFTWRNIALFAVALTIMSCLTASGMIIAVDRLISANWQQAEGTQRVQPLKIRSLDRN